MAHLLKIRKGWENENLARFILSKFSFISQPSTIADDLGVDFFCTFFIKKAKERKTKNNKTIKDVFIYPKHSFAIQIKSNSRQLNITKKLEFFDNLEIPFFIGVVSQKKLSISIYSGDLIPEIFSYVGLPPSDNKENITVNAALLKKRKNHEQHPRQIKYIIPFFKIGELSAVDTEEKSKPFIENFSKICFYYQRNIISKKKQQYLFHDAVSLKAMILAGEGSYQFFENNFSESLAEVFCNLAWDAPQRKDEEKFMQKYNLYKKLYLEMQKIYGENPLLEDCFNRLENAVKQI